MNAKRSSAWVLNSVLSEFESRHRRHRGRGREAQALDCRSRLREFESRRSRWLNAGVAERNEALLF